MNYKDLAQKNDVVHIVVDTKYTNYCVERPLYTSHASGYDSAGEASYHLPPK